jgi:hypothetical protein
MIPEHFRQSAEHRKLWATMEYLCECDPAGPFLHGGVEKSADQHGSAKAAAERRRTVLEHRAADEMRAYFREEREHIVPAVARGDFETEVDGDGALVVTSLPALDALRDDLIEAYWSVWGGAADEWAKWVAGHARDRVAKYREDQERDEDGRWVDEGGGSRGSWARVQARDFIAARSKTTRPGFLSHLEPADLKDHRLYTNPDSTVGFAIDPKGDAQNLFNNDGPQGAGTIAVFDSVRKGGRTLDCFDGYLPRLYTQAGFVETGRMKFDADQAPDDWDYRKDDQPDVVFMAWKGWPDDDERRAEDRAIGDKDGWLPWVASTRYYDDYGKAKEDSRGGALPRPDGAAGRGKAPHRTGGESVHPAMPRAERHAGVAKADEPAYDYGAPIDAWLRENAGKRIVGINETTRKRIAAEIAAGRAAGETLRQIARRIDKFYLEDIIPHRSMTIAVTEVGHAANWSQNFIAEDTAERGVPMEKEWGAIFVRTREAHEEADGQRVPLDEPFDVGGEKMMYPGDETLGAGPENIINCHCFVMYHVVDEEAKAKAAEVPAALPTPAEFAKTVLGVENSDVVTALAFARGVFSEGDDWVRARKTVMKHVRQLRRAAPVEKYEEGEHPRDERGRWTDSGAAEASPSAPGDPIPGRADVVRQRVREAERAHAHASVEHARVVSRSGAVLFDRSDGAASSIDFTPADMWTFRDNRGAVLTHNHPGGDSFSKDDIAFARQAGLSEIRASTRDAVFSMRPGPRGWPYTDDVFMWHLEVDAAVVLEINTKVAEGLGISEAYRMHFDEVWRRIAAAHPEHLVYSKEATRNA